MFNLIWVNIRLKMSESGDMVEEDRTFLKNSLKACLRRLDETKIAEFVEKMLDDGINKDTVSVVEQENLEELGFDKYQAKAVVQHWAKGSVGTLLLLL